MPTGPVTAPACPTAQVQGGSAYTVASYCVQATVTPASTPVVPEPSTLLLFVAGLVALLAMRKGGRVDELRRAHDRRRRPHD